MAEVTLAWQEVNINDNIIHEYAYFYAFTDKYDCVYIGMSYDQKIMDEITQRLDNLGLDSDEVSIWVGYIKDSDYEKISKELVRDIECLMIYYDKPEYNTLCKENYTGRDNLEISSEGCPFLETYIES